VKKIKVLHVLGGLEAGGVETWLFNVVQQFDLSVYQMDFMIFSGSKGVYGNALELLGCKIYMAPKTKNPFKVAGYYIKTIKVENYDIVHTHRHFLCGLYLIFNKFTNAKFIAHSHNTSTDSRIFKNKIIASMAKQLTKRAPNKLACSVDAGIVLFNEPSTIIYYGINTQNFKPSLNKLLLLEDLYQPNENDVVIGHVGRFTEQKNHHFLLDIAKVLIAETPNYHFILIGDGVLKNEIAERIEKENLKHNVHLIGPRTDVNEFMRGFFDVYLFPSLYEGFGIVLIESQCAGLPTVFSSNLPQTVDVIPELINRVNLDKDANWWAKQVTKLALPGYNQKLDYQKRFEQSPFSIQHSAQKLKTFYEDILKN